MEHCQLVFENGKVMRGKSLGVSGQVAGTLMPYISMTDYQSILCDPAMQDQIICMSYPLIGNVGQVDDVTMPDIHAAGLIMRESIPTVDHWLSRSNLRDWLKAQKIIAVAGIDTREIIRMLRQEGALRVVLSTQEEALSDLIAQAKAFEPKKNLPTRDDVGQYAPTKKVRHRIAALDLGMHPKLLKALRQRGCEVTVFPAQTCAQDLLEASFDALLLSSGPEQAVQLNTEKLLPMLREVKAKLPVWGIDAGHLLLARSFDLDLRKLPLGHHGANYPVKDLACGRTFMTQQHHQLVVDEKQLQDRSDCHITHQNINDQSVEGLYYEGGHRSLQFLPDAENEKHQTGYIWDELLQSL